MMPDDEYDVRPIRRPDGTILEPGWASHALLAALADVRHMGDIDCDIPDEHGAEALALLRSLGFNVVPLAESAT